ncbi:hypothetical protein [Paraburkholderia sp. MM6662-R1]|uniref:hypothetical protein n=1 Tax=Paraburkholderia sp. MM6662-R1 TaxID=2991066 RepID=UPI003D1CB187
MHRISTLLLNPDYRPDIRRDAVSWAISRKASELGLILDNRPHLARIAELLNEHSMRSLLQRTRVLADKSSLSDLLMGRRVYANPVQCIGLLSLMHGTWLNFEKWLTNNPSPTDSKMIQNEKPSRTPSTATLKFKKWASKHEERLFSEFCVKYAQARQVHPNKNHTEIVKSLRRSHGRITSKSKLREAGIDVPEFSHSRETKDYEKIDRSLHSHVLARAKALIEDGFPKPITRPVLTQGHEHAGDVGNLQKHLPRTKAALEAFVEDRTAWRRRLGGASGPGSRVKRTQQKRETKQEDFSFVQPVTGVTSVQ